MPRDQLEALAVELLGRLPDYAEDVLNVQAPQPPPPSSSSSSGNVPAWCVCTFCQTMPTADENKCCDRADCLVGSRLFSLFCLNTNVIELGMRDRDDILCSPPVRNNDEYRYAAYRQFILWQYGKLSAGERISLPSCCVLAIRNKFPSPDGQYKGFVRTRVARIPQ